MLIRELKVEGVQTDGAAIANTPVSTEREQVQEQQELRKATAMVFTCLVLGHSP